MIPVRCFTCGKVIADKWILYNNYLANEEYTSKEALEKINFKRYCCNRMFLSHISIVDKLICYQTDDQNNENKFDQKISEF